MIELESASLPGIPVEGQRKKWREKGEKGELCASGVSEYIIRL